MLCSDNTGCSNCSDTGLLLQYAEFKSVEQSRVAITTLHYYSQSLLELHGGQYLEDICPFSVDIRCEYLSDLFFKVDVRDVVMWYLRYFMNYLCCQLGGCVIEAAQGPDFRSSPTNSTTLPDPLKA